MGAFLEQLFAGLKSAAPWAVRMGSVIGTRFAAWFPRLTAWFSRNAFLLWIFTKLGELGIKLAAQALTITIFLGAWGVLWFGLGTAASGVAIWDFFHSNPFSGTPAAVLYLLTQVFPLKFLVGSVAAYMGYRMTVIQAALVFSKVVKTIYGS